MRHVGVGIIRMEMCGWVRSLASSLCVPPSYTLFRHLLRVRSLGRMARCCVMNHLSYYQYYYDTRRPIQSILRSIPLVAKRMLHLEATDSY